MNPRDLILLGDAIRAVKEEPELPGPIPAELLEVDKESLCRAVVVATKRSIMARLAKCHVVMREEAFIQYLDVLDEVHKKENPHDA